MNPVVEAFSRIASEYDALRNIESCWGSITLHSLGLVTLRDGHKTVADIGCGTGRELARLASACPPGVRFIGVEPAANMRSLAVGRTAHFPNVRIIDGRFERLPLESQSIDYLYSILAFHWTTDLGKSVAELARVMKPTGELDMTFIGRHNGREFIRKTTPVFFKYMTPASMIKAASLRKQMTLEAATALFRTAFSAPGLSVTESYHTCYDTLEGHWGWWGRIESQLVDLPEAKRAECEQAVRRAIAMLATDKGIPYSFHLLHVRLRRQELTERAVSRDGTHTVERTEMVGSGHEEL
jgi:ubiquinone/menaquinone biosynthesis C-methylase UbiE